MGCCGCSLYGLTVTAGALTLLDSVMFLTFDVFVLLFLILAKIWKPSDNDFKHFIEGFEKINQEDTTTLYILIGIKLGLRIVWFLSGILLLIGNSREYRKFINIWKYLTISKVIYSIGISIYALVKFISDIKKLFNSDKTWSQHYENGDVPKFVILMDFLELGPIWLIIFIALAIYVHQRGEEVNTKKRDNVNHWGNFSHTNQSMNSQNHMNGKPQNGETSLTRAMSLTREPTPFTIAGNNITENNSVEPNSALQRNPSSRTRNTPLIAVPESNETVKPILEINSVISIPRVTLKPNLNGNFDANHEKKRHVSSLAKRSSYFEFERDVNKVPKRNNSYNLAQNSGKKYHSYDNRAFDKKTESDLYKPVLIQRPSFRRTQNQ